MFLDDLQDTPQLLDHFKNGLQVTVFAAAFFLVCLLAQLSSRISIRNYCVWKSFITRITILGRFSSVGPSVKILDRCVVVMTLTWVIGAFNPITMIRWYNTWWRDSVPGCARFIPTSPYQGLILLGFAARRRSRISRGWVSTKLYTVARGELCFGNGSNLELLHFYKTCFDVFERYVLIFPEWSD